MKKALFLFSIFISQTAFSLGDMRTLSSAKGILLGDAYTAVADDEFTMFYNPATLARHRGFSLFPLNPMLSAVNVLNDKDRFKDFPEEPVDIYNRIAEYPINMGISYAPGFKLGNFALSVILNNQNNAILLNKVSPKLHLDRRYDRGFAIGYGLPIMGGLSSKGNGTQVSIGASLKYIKREGVSDSFSLTSPTMLDIIDAGDINEILEKLGRAKGQGFAGNFGIEFLHQNRGTSFSVGLSFLDAFSKITADENPENVSFREDEMQMHLGLGVGQKFVGGIQYRFSLDIQNLNDQDLDFTSRLRMGLEFGIENFKVLVGRNGENLSYGVAMDLFLFGLYAGLYEVEPVKGLSELKSKQGLIYLSLFDFTFDA